MLVEPAKGLPSFQLHFARQYIYLGTQLDEKGNIGLELAHRRREAAPSWRALVRQFYAILPAAGCTSICICSTH